MDKSRSREAGDAMTDIPVIAEAPIGDGSGAPSSYAVTISDDDVMRALGDFLSRVTGAEVIQGQQNRVPEPKSANFITMISAGRVQLATTTHESDIEVNRIAATRSTRCDMQINVYGPRATDNGQIITTLFRDDFGCEFLAPYGMAPLYCDDGRQMPLVNGEFQYEQRWLIRASLQINPSVSTPAQFADTVTPTFVEVA